MSVIRVIVLHPYIYGNIWLLAHDNNNNPYIPSLKFVDLPVPK